MKDLRPERLGRSPSATLEFEGLECDDLQLPNEEATVHRHPALWPAWHSPKEIAVSMWHRAVQYRGQMRRAITLRRDSTTLALNGDSKLALV